MALDILANIDWLPGDDLWWIAGMGVAIAFLAFLLGARLLARQPVLQARQPVLDGPQPSEKPGDPFDAGPSGDRRQGFRRKGSSITVQMSEVGPDAEAHPGRVMERSVSGLALWSERKAAIGTLLKVRPDHAPAMTPWVEVEVRNCKEYEGGWQLGCAFLRTPPYTILLLFG